MDRRKLNGKRRKRLNQGKRRKSFQEFIDDIGNVINERKEMKELFKRVLIFEPEKVMEEMEIRKRNNEILEAHRLKKAAAKEINNECGNTDKGCEDKIEDVDKTI